MRARFRTLRRRRALRRALRWGAAGVGLLALAAVAVPVGGIELGCRGSAVEAPAPTAGAGIDLPGYRRSEVASYYTFPEWYIVYAAEDFARHLGTGDESGFPYLAQVSGFWRSFCGINRLVAGRGESAAETKLMIYTIGVSFTVEYALKGLYENTVGRAAEWLRGAEKTPEDRFAHAVAADYAAFLHRVPWYDYPFGAKLAALWAETPAAGPNLVRKWERRFALSSEYAVKAGYAWVIRQGLAATSDPAPREIMFVARNLSPEALAADPRVRVVRDLGGGRVVAVAPRYRAFRDVLTGLLARGAAVDEIAGNDDILVTVLVPEGRTLEAEGVRELFAMPLGARPGWRRVGLDARVASLDRSVPALLAAGAEIEHVYDY